MSKELICANCGFKGTPKKVTKENILIEIILWLFFIIPGLIYSIWRLTTKYKACPKCGATNMVPIDSPIGKKLLKEVIGLFLIFLLMGCAATYTQPTTIAPNISDNVKASKADILRSAKQILVTEGYQITSYDDSAGIISTAPKNLKVTPEQADCGKTMGIDYLKDKRTATKVAFGILALDNKITVKTTIEGEYKPGTVDQNIVLTCVSRGLLERDMLSKIIAMIPK